MNTTDTKNKWKLQKGLVTLTPFAERLEVELSLPVFTTKVAVLHWLMDCIGFYAVSALFQPCNGGSEVHGSASICTCHNTQFYNHFWRYFFPSNHPYITIFSSSTNYQHEDYSILQIIASLQKYHFVTIHILAEPLKASLNGKVGCLLWISS